METKHLPGKLTKPATMFQIPRAELIAWTEGVLMDRDKDGRVLAPREELCRKAEKELEANRKVILTVGGKPFSYLQPLEEGYQEMRFEE